MVEWLFLLRLGKVERDTRGGFDISNRNGFLRARLMHRNGSPAALVISGILRLRK